MEIKIQINKKVYSITFGRERIWHQSVYLVTIVEEMYDHNLKLMYAKFIKGFFPEKADK